MALSFDELEMQSAEALPAREVMSSIGSSYWGPSGNEYIGGLLNGLNFQDFLNEDTNINLFNLFNGVVDGGDSVV